MTSLPSRYCLRHANTTLALMSCRRATIDTDMPGSNVSLITCCLNSCAYVRWGCVRPAAFDMADCLRQAERAHHASKYSALRYGRAESLTELLHPLREELMDSRMAYVRVEEFDGGVRAIAAHRSLEGSLSNGRQAGCVFAPRFDATRVTSAPEIRSSLVYERLMAGDVRRRVFADRVDRLAPVRRP